MSDSEPARERAKEHPTEISSEPARTRTSEHRLTPGFWVALVFGLVVLLLLIIFILENGQRSSIAFMGAHGHLPQGVALLLAAVIGSLFVVLAGAARVLQLRSRTNHRNVPHARGFRRHQSVSRNPPE